MNIWDKRFLDMAKLVSSWSKDPSTKCGCVIADNQNRVVSIGYNGFPSGFPDDQELWNNREKKLMLVIHAEMNAVLFANTSLAGCTAYTYPFPPCSNCASVLSQCGITRIVAPTPTKELQERWGKSMKLADLVYQKKGIVLCQV